MTEHLPECPVWRCCKPDERATMHTCICPDDERIVGLITRQRAEQIGRNIGQYGCVTEHLPECPVKSVVCEGEFCHCDYAHFCNCNELRAREERIGGLITRQRAEQIGRNIGQYGCVITEQRHLPECPMLEPFSAETKEHCFCTRKNPCIHDEMECICERLRACEERVREIAYAQKRGAGSDAHRQHEIGWMKGYDAALDDARESVADINGKWVFGPRIYKHKAIAAIDALRDPVA